MAFVTARRGGRFEIRETRRTAHGPRATTLVSFRSLNDDVLAQARQRATGSVNLEQIRAGARRVGAPVELGEPDQLARRLLRALAGGGAPAPGLRRALVDALTALGTEADGDLAGLAQWIGVPDVERGRALEDLLGLADALPAPRVARQLDFPRLASTRHG
jgi:hypothetical protein